MLFTPEPPQLEPDVEAHQIPAEPNPAEYGVYTFGRTIAAYLTRLLGIDVAPPVYRENRWDIRPVPKASTFELAVGEHHVLITLFEVRPALVHDSLPAYAIHLDGQRVPFELASYRDVDWQLARATWIAITDARPRQENLSSVTKACPLRP